MRKFTKEHNELEWLFPFPYNKTGSCGQWFDFYESMAPDLLKSCYGNQETFTKDDMIDAFMKGASEAHQFINSSLVSNQIDNDIRIRSLLKESERINFLIEEIKDKLDIKDNETNKE